MRYKLQYIILTIFFTTSCNAQNPIESNSQIDGKWNIKLNSNDIGTVNTILEFESSIDGSFTAWTRKGADRNILGFWKSTLARVFTKDFKNGSLIRITDGTVTKRQDTLVLSGIFRSAMSNYYFNGEIVNNKITAELRDGKKVRKGTISGFRSDDVVYPLDDYPAIVSEALDSTKNRIYNRDVLNTKEWKSFEKSITKKSRKFQDDLELVFGFFYLASDLPFSHFALTKIEELNEAEKSDKNQYLFLEEKTNNTALLTIKSFSGTSTEVDSVFSEIIEKKYENLIVDLRNNSGGTVEAGMAFARRVVDTTMTGGFFLTQNWFNQNNDVPDSNQLEKLPVFSEANYDLIIQGIHQEIGLVLKVEPQNPLYKGNLFIITNSKTASTCEPIVHCLKNANRATIIGEKTAGAMLNGERFKLNRDFSLYVPTADYYTIDGLRIDQNGVTPNIELESEDPIEYIMKQLIK
ncbi:MAG TPA: S41 family peptidase [Bacteroidales bacterium]|jgi:hypothetical protein|nr:S41 family peptidase [Bacteroidales bacterium]HXK90688.1 S41 family peptidase [Bacteroidales bacterium]